MAETFRSGLEAIDKVQTESAYSLGMTKKADACIYYFTAGNVCQCTGFYSKCHLPSERDQCVLCNQSDGFDVHSQKI